MLLTYTSFGVQGIFHVLILVFNALRRVVSFKILKYLILTSKFFIPNIVIQYFFALNIRYLYNYNIAYFYNNGGKRYNSL